MAEVFESQLAWLEVGLPVNMTLKAFAGKTWQGRVNYIFPNVNATNRTQQVRVVFDNPDLILKPNMFAQLSIQAKSLDASLLVPNEAVIVTGLGERVVLSEGDGHYRSVNVKTGQQSNGLTQVLSGVSLGQHVVTSAQFLIDSESNIEAELSRIDSVDAESIDRVWVSGTIKALSDGAMTLEHEPVKKWQWPAMVMSLPVSQEVDVSTLNVGDKIGFCLDEFSNKRYVITHVELEKKSTPDMDHDMHKKGVQP